MSSSTYTRKHYRQFAEILHNRRPDEELDIREAIARETVDKIASDIADMFGHDNQNFRRYQFIQAVEEGLDWSKR